MSRDSTNLLRKLYEGDEPSLGYPKKDWQRLCQWLTEVHDDARSAGTFYLPNGPRSNLRFNPQFRIDCQGHFNLKSYPRITWVNLQVQENKPRQGKSTTVMTTYVHWQGYNRSTEPTITGAVVCGVMETQVKHAIPEMTIFVERERNGTLRVRREPRTPHGLLEYNPSQGIANPYQIWEA